MPLLSLPVDLLPHIIDEVESRNDLCKAALVCRTFCSEAQRQLFRDVSLYSKPESRQDDTICSLQFFRVLQSSPNHPARLIKVFRMNNVWAAGANKEEHAQNAELLDNMRLGLNLMVNLKFLVYGENGSPPPSGIACGATLMFASCKFRLTSIRWLAHAAPADFLKLLQAQPELKLVVIRELNSTSDVIDYPEGVLDGFRLLGSQVCPNLQRLYAPRPLADWLIGGKKLEWLCWPCHMMLLDPPIKNSISHIAKELSQVQYMEVGRTKNIGERLQDLARVLTSVRILKVAIFGEGDLVSLSQLPQLEVLIAAAVIVYHEPGGGRIRQTIEMTPDIVRKVFTICPRLRHIDVESNGELAEPYQGYVQLSDGSGIQAKEICQESVWHSYSQLFYKCYTPETRGWGRGRRAAK